MKLLEATLGASRGSARIRCFVESRSSSVRTQRNQESLAKPISARRLELLESHLRCPNGKWKSRTTACGAIRIPTMRRGRLRGPIAKSRERQLCVTGRFALCEGRAGRERLLTATAATSCRELRKTSARARPE